MVRLRADGIKHQIVLMFSVKKEMMSSAENEVALEYDEGWREQEVFGKDIAGDDKG